MNTIKEAGPVQRWIFWTAYEAKKKALAQGEEQ